MPKKYYAVKSGRVCGIYETWDDCKKQVMGFSGAEYKSFTKKSEAEEFLGIINSQQINIEDDYTIDVYAYTDGSYDVKTGRFSYGVIIFENGQKHEFKKAFDKCDFSSMRNVAGEIMGSQFIMQYCIDNNIPSVEIFYDYEGIEKWCSGAWKANKEGTIIYRDYYNSIKDKLFVKFTKVKGHSGDKYNDEVDMLAKSALGLI